MKRKKLSFYSFFVWTLAILFFFYEFFLRVLPATAAKYIIPSLDLTIEQFALIGSAYYMTYAFMQIPVGILLDRFSAKILATVAAALCSFGVLWFSVAEGFIPAFLGRLMIGLGSAFGFVGLMVVTLNWFPKKYFAFLVGCGQSLGAIGPLCAGAPIALMISAAQGDWRRIFLWVGVIGIILTVLIGLFLQGKPTSKDAVIFVDRKASLTKRLKALLKDTQIWLILSYSAMIYVALPILGAFWGTLYLEARGFSNAKGAFMISMIWVGLAIGSPVFGRVSDIIKRRKPLIAICACCGVISSVLVLSTQSKNEFYLSILFFLIGFGGSGQNLSFAIIAERSPKSLRATALGINNTAIMGCAAVAPSLVTWIIKRFTEGDQLTEFAFQRGLLLIPLFFTCALLIALFGIKETFCRQQNEIHTIKKR